MQILVSIRMLESMRSSRFRTLFGGQALALVAAEFHLLALAWLALEITGSGLALGSVLLAGLAPRIVFALLGGVAADRLDLRRVMVAANATRAAVVAAFAVTVTSGAAQLWHLYVVAVLLGAVTSFYRPALFAAVPRVCPNGLRAANGLMRGTAETLGAVGPLAAGALVATIGVGAAFWVTAGCYTVAAVMLVGLDVRPVTSAPEQRRRTSVAVELRTGLRTVWDDAYLRRALALVTVAGLALTGPVTVGVPWLAHQQLAATAVAFGLMLSMWSAGSVAGALAAGTLRGAPGWRPLTTMVIAVLAVGLLALGFAGQIAVAAVALLVMGAVAGFFNVLLITEVQRRAEAGSLGRVMSVVELAEIVSTPASYLLAGLLLDASSAVLFAAAAGLLVIGGLPVLIRGPREATAVPG
jgi:MFS family permease